MKVEIVGEVLDDMRVRFMGTHWLCERGWSLLKVEHKLIKRYIEDLRKTNEKQ